MGSRNSPMKAKVFTANTREFRIYTRELRDDGMQRRLNSEPTSSAALREQSREREPFVSRGELIRVELFRRARMTPEQRAVRAQFVGTARQAVK